MSWDISDQVGSPGLELPGHRRAARRATNGHPRTASRSVASPTGRTDLGSIGLRRRSRRSCRPRRRRRPGPVGEPRKISFKERMEVWSQQRRSVYPCAQTKRRALRGALRIFHCLTHFPTGDAVVIGEAPTVRISFCIRVFVRANGGRLLKHRCVPGGGSCVIMFRHSRSGWSSS